MHVVGVYVCTCACIRLSQAFISVLECFCVCIICMFGSCFSESVMWHDGECIIHLSVTILCKLLVNRHFQLQTPIFINIEF